MPPLRKANVVPLKRPTQTCHSEKIPQGSPNKSTATNLKSSIRRLAVSQPRHLNIKEISRSSKTKTHSLHRSHVAHFPLGGLNRLLGSIRRSPLCILPLDFHCPRVDFIHLLLLH